MKRLNIAKVCLRNAHVLKKIGRKTLILVEMRRQRVLIKSSPSRKPFSLPILMKLADQQNVQINSSVHIHSDLILDDNQRDSLLNYLPKSAGNNSNGLLEIMLMWSATQNDEVFFQIGNGRTVMGEVNLVKYLSTKLGIFEVNLVDEAKMDEFYAAFLVAKDEKKLFEEMKKWMKGKFISKNGFGLLDVLAYSHCAQIAPKKLPKDILQWSKDCQKEIESPCLPQETSENGSEKLFDFFKKNNLDYDVIEHPEVFTVETMMPYLANVDGAVSKNLFLKDKKGTLYLLSALHDKNVNLNQIAKAANAPGGLRFASEDLLYETLGVKQGCVTAFALLNDDRKKVKFLVDEELVNGKYPRVYFHPLRNSASTSLTCQDFKRFVELTAHEMVPIKV